MGIHAGSLALLNIIVKGIGCHGNDRNGPGIRIAEMADIGSCRQAVHEGHPDIHQNGIIIPFFGFAEQLQSTQPILRSVHSKSLPLQQHNRNLCVQRMVLCQKYTLPCEIIVHVRFFFLFLLLILFPQCPGERRDQGGFEHGLADEQIHAGHLCLMFNGTPVICRHNDDCHLRPYNAADTPGCLNPVHLRHFPVYEYHVKIFSVIPQVLYPVHCL